jgi:hypothetical protein
MLFNILKSFVSILEFNITYPESRMILQAKRLKDKERDE